MRPSTPRAVGLITGVMLRRMHSRKGSVSTPVTSPTKPMSTSSPEAPLGQCFRQVKISAPENPRALPPRAVRAFTISGLISRDSTCSTTFTAASPVTRRPWTKAALSPAESMARVMAMPPPWTTTGLMPTASRNTMSRATPSRTGGSGESMKLPPYLTTNVWLRKRWMYGRASSKVAALAIKSCIGQDENLLWRWNATLFAARPGESEDRVPANGPAMQDRVLAEVRAATLPTNRSGRTCRRHSGPRLGAPGAGLFPGKWRGGCGFFGDDEQERASDPERFSVVRAEQGASEQAGLLQHASDLGRCVDPVPPPSRFGLPIPDKDCGGFKATDLRQVAVLDGEQDVFQLVPFALRQGGEERFGRGAGLDHESAPGFERARHAADKRDHVGKLKVSKAVAEAKSPVELRVPAQPAQVAMDEFGADARGPGLGGGLGEKLPGDVHAGDLATAPGQFDCMPAETAGHVEQTGLFSKRPLEEVRLDAGLFGPDRLAPQVIGDSVEEILEPVGTGGHGMHFS